MLDPDDLTNTKKTLLIFYCFLIAKNFMLDFFVYKLNFIELI